MYICTHAHTEVFIYIYTHTHWNIYIYFMYIYIYTLEYLYICILCIYTHTGTFICTHTCSVYICTHTTFCLTIHLSIFWLMCVVSTFWLSWTMLIWTSVLLRYVFEDASASHSFEYILGAGWLICWYCLTFWGTAKLDPLYLRISIARSTLMIITWGPNWKEASSGAPQEILLAWFQISCWGWGEWSQSQMLRSRRGGSQESSWRVCLHIMRVVLLGQEHVWESVSISFRDVSCIGSFWPLGVCGWQLPGCLWGQSAFRSESLKLEAPAGPFILGVTVLGSVTEHIWGCRKAGALGIQSGEQCLPRRNPTAIRLQWVSWSWDSRRVFTGDQSPKEEHTHLRPCLRLCSAWFWWSE